MSEPIRLGEPVGGVEVRLRAVLPPEDLEYPYYTGYHVIETSGDVAAAVTTMFGGPGLGVFLTGLAEDFRGWTGERTWESFYGELAVSATHESRGHVRLRWRLASGDWTLTTTTIADAGEDMRRMAADVHELEQGLERRS